MKIKLFMYVSPLFFLVTSCQTSRQDDVVCETYIHRYGVPLPAEDWSARGQHGQVMATLKNGVVVTKSYDSGTLHGETTYTYPHQDMIQKRELYEQGTLRREIWNHPNGIPQRQCTYETPNRQDLLIWYESGAPQSKEIHEQGVLLEGEYFNPHNHREALVEGTNGTRIRRDPYGQMISVDEIREGQMVSSTTYHSTGTPESITPYVNGQIQGLRRTFFPSGEPQTIEEWSENVQHGTTVIFQNGEKYAEMPYRLGRREGMERRYREGSILIQEATWENDQQHGPCYSYVGNSRKIDWYFRDRKVPNKETFDALRNQ
jgi:antitoxin component YwqK of YwqJK toxin-antitoxin module